MYTSTHVHVHHTLHNRRGPICRDNQQLVDCYDIPRTPPTALITSQLSPSKGNSICGKYFGQNNKQCVEQNSSISISAETL